MPELPEVETLRRELSVIKGKIIELATIKWPKMTHPLSPAKFQQKLKNKKIVSVNRRAKILILKLSDGNYILIHLKMTGQLIYKPYVIGHKLIIGGHPLPPPPNSPLPKDHSGAGGQGQEQKLLLLPNKHTHIIIDFKDKSILYFNDLRKFGWMRLVGQQDIDELENNFGPEPLSDKFSFKVFKQTISRYPNRKIKQTLMDPKIIAGIGNIYADESCFCARVLPMRRVKDITELELKKIYQCLRRILKLAISKRGTSVDTYIQLDGSRGGFVPYLMVYGRGGQLCKKCDQPIKKIKLAGRGTHFCGSCQT